MISFREIIIQKAYGFHPCDFRAPIPLAEGYPPTRPLIIRGRGARGGSFPSGQPSQPLRTREGLGYIAGSDILPCLYSSDTPGTRSISPGSIPPRTLRKPQSQGPIVDWLGRVERRQLGEDRSPSTVQTSLHISTTPTPRGRKLSFPRSTPLHSVKTPIPRADR